IRRSVANVGENAAPRNPRSSVGVSGPTVRSETSRTGRGCTGQAAGSETSRLHRTPTWSTTNNSPSRPGAVMPFSGAMTSVVTGVRATRTGPGATRAGMGSPTGRLRVGDPRSAAAGTAAQRTSGTPATAATSSRRPGRERRTDMALLLSDEAGPHRPRPARPAGGGSAGHTLRITGAVQVAGGFAVLGRYLRTWALPARPGVAALLEERLHARPEVLAAVRLGDEVVAIRHVCLAQAPERLLRHAQRDRREAGDALGEVEHVRLDLVGRHARADESGRERLIGGNHPRREDEVLRARLAENRREPRVAGHRQAVAQRARDRQAELRLRRAHAQVARRGDRQPGADRVALDLRDRRLAQAVEAAEVAVDARLVLDAGLARVEVEELADVGARDERAAARAAQDEHADVVVCVDLVAVRVQRLVHRERHRVARVRAVERDDRHGPAPLVEELRLVGHGPCGRRSARGGGGAGRGGGLAVGADAPERDLGLVDHEARGLAARREARGRPDDAVDVVRRAARAADDVVVVVADARLVARGAAR